MSMDDPFGEIGDPRELLREAGESMMKAEEAADTALDVGQQYIELFEDTQQQRQQNLIEASQSLGNIYDNIETASENITRASALPRVLSDLIGIVDDDYDIEHQQARIRNEQFKADRVQLRAKQHNARLETQERLAQVQFATAEAAARLSAGAATDRLQYYSAALRIPEEERQILIDRIEGMSTEDMQKALSNDPTASKDVQEVMLAAPGLIEQEYNSRMTSTTQLAIQQESLNQIERSRELEAMGDRSLGALAQSSTPTKSGLTAADAKEEIARRRTRDMALEAQQLQLEGAENTMVQTLKQQFLTQSSLGTLQQSIVGLGPDDTVEIEGLEYTVAEVQGAIQTKRDSVVERAIEKADLQAKIASSQADAAAVNRIASDFHVNSADQARLAALNTQVSATVSAVNATQRGSVAHDAALGQFNAAIAALNEQTEKIKSQYVASQPEDYREAAQEYAELGTVQTFENAAKVLYGEATGVAFASSRPLYSDVMHSLSQEVAKVRNTDAQKATSLVRGPDGSVIGVAQSDERDPVLVMRDVIETQGVNTDMANLLFQHGAAAVGKFLRNTEPEIWGAIFQPDGTFNQMVYETNDATGETAFSYARMLQLFDAVSRRAVDNGLLDRSDPHMTTQFRQMMMGYSQSKEFQALVTPQNLDEAAVLKAVANNAPQRLFLSRLKPMGSGAVTAAEQTVTELQSVIAESRRAKPMAIDPVVDPLLEQSMQQRTPPPGGGLSEFERAIADIIPPRRTN